MAASGSPHGQTSSPANLLSASDMMMLGLFPPSSRVTRLRLLFPAATWIRRPTWREAETETSSVRGGTTKCSHRHNRGPHNSSEKLDYKRPGECCQIWPSTYHRCPTLSS